ncbi:MAG: anhydro-N-acetylmuramic acid kinase [Gammaproteobacteria bacterium]|nr:MAG: anhydro-N-acetylmuramic acid kinase [Gammaproteobacteria bacterium]
MDAVDAALARFPAEGRVELVAARAHPLPEALRAELRALAGGTEGELERLARADRALGELLAEAALALLAEAGVGPAAVAAIGSHGQTVRHLPGVASVQIGDPARVAERTGITVVADFRRRDLAAGGQGAPLAPAFHAAVLRRPGRERAVLNLGGIANLTVLPADPRAPVLGFDTGPANTLLDAWARRHLGRPYDAGGRWAAGGRVHPGLLERLLADPYFAAPPPKSTGPEHFGLGWLEEALARTPGAAGLAPRDVQATLCELTAATVAQAVEAHAPKAEELLLCGGGVANAELLRRLAERLPGRRVLPTDAAGVPARWMEALLFAWLARQTLAGRPGNLPSVTGARRAVVLGAVHPAVRPGAAGAGGRGGRLPQAPSR